MFESGHSRIRGDSATELVDLTHFDGFDNTVYNAHKDNNVLWLPVPLKTRLCQSLTQDDSQPCEPVLTSDVVLWLLELRHCTHLYDSLYSSELTMNHDDSDSLCICQGNSEYLDITSSFKDSNLQTDVKRECQSSRMNEEVHVESFNSLIPSSHSGSQVLNNKTVTYLNRNLNSHVMCLSSNFAESKCVDKSIEEEPNNYIESYVWKNNLDSSHNVLIPPVWKGWGTMDQLMWQANPVYRGVPAVHWESETNTLMASGGDAKLRKWEVEGVAALGPAMYFVSAVEEADRCSHLDIQICGVGNFPVDNNQVAEVVEHYDNINVNRNARDRELSITSYVKNGTEETEHVDLQNECESVRGIYCIQESVVDSTELCVSVGDELENCETSFFSKNTVVQQCVSLKNEDVNKCDSLHNISFDSLGVLKGTDINQNVNNDGIITYNVVETNGIVDSLCGVTKLSGECVSNDDFSNNCEVLLKHFKDVIVTLESMDGTCHPNEISMSQQNSEFNSIFYEVENLADEVLEECNAQPIIVPEAQKKKIHIVSCTSSDLSDDVFLTCAATECSDSEFNFDSEPHIPCSEQKHDINSIFDNGMKPPVRPERKKFKEKLKTVQCAGDRATDTQEHANGDDNLKPTCEDNFLCTESSHVDEETVSVNNSEDLLLLQRVSMSSKEKRSLRTLSLYEDADMCCEGNNEDHVCNIISISPVSIKDENLSIGGELYPAMSSFISGKHDESPHISLFHNLKHELLSEECSSPNYLSESFGELLNVSVPQLKSISSCQFPPEDFDEVECEHNMLSTQSVNRISGAPGEFDSLEEHFSSVDSHVRSRKGSGSSDIAAWKQDLQKSVLSWFDDECENEWFSSLDSEGRVYYFEENSCESSWALPSIDAVSFNKTQDGFQASEIPKNENVKKKREQMLKSLENDEDLPLRHKQIFSEDVVEEMRTHGRVSKSRSMVLFDPKHKAGFLKSSVTTDWPQLWKGDMGVLKEGLLNRTKITENGKRLRKNWSPAYVVLTELFLLVFKDAKAFAAMKSSSNSSGSNPAHPELCIDLNGALISHASKESSRKNVFIISTVLGLQVLLQSDNSQLADKWYEEIDSAIKNLPSGYDVCTRLKPLRERMDYLRPYSPDDGKKSHMIERSRSVKVRNKDGSSEDLSASPDERQTKIRDRLKKFFHRRPTKELLMKKGIYKDEPVFGRHLADVCINESPPIPRFVRLCIEAIEGKEENMKADGLYRASGNLSQVQKIRLQVDQNNLAVLEQEEDVHVLTGALKLFFRELKSPVIPFEFFNIALQASTNTNKKEKIHQFQVIIKKLPTENRCTLEYLLQHLLKVTKYHKSNRMHISNLAIVFGPTLMWPEEESLNMAFDLMQQNLVIECFLQEFDSIFR